MTPIRDQGIIIQHNAARIFKGCMGQTDIRGIKARRTSEGSRGTRTAGPSETNRTWTLGQDVSQGRKRSLIWAVSKGISSAMIGK